MELREVMGRRRSIRFVRPYKPVEPWKIQYMFEAARLASHWGNVQSLNGIAIVRESARAELLDTLKASINGWQVKIAPVVIVWYLETKAVENQADRLRELVSCGAVGFGNIEESLKGLEETLIPYFERMTEQMKASPLGLIDAGQGIAQATLAAFEVGLGTCCLTSPNADELMQAVGAPDSARLLLLQTVGYPAEHWEAGGQRPRLPFGQRFFLNDCDTPYPRDDALVEQLTADGLFTTPAPMPGREAEQEFIKNGLNLKGLGLI